PCRIAVDYAVDDRAVILREPVVVELPGALRLVRPGTQASRGVAAVHFHREILDQRERRWRRDGLTAAHEPAAAAVHAFDVTQRYVVAAAATKLVDDDT